jgi:MYXO-CTERM domain-containing protein
MKALLRGSLASLLGFAALFAAPVALADGEPCINDDDCPGTECGTAVCNWNKPQAGGKFTCNPAGTDPPMNGKPKDGWCTTNDDCKCKAQGATCSTAPYCTFTTPPAGSAGTGAGGSAPTAGTPSTAGTTSTAGASTAGTTSTGGTGTTPAPAADSGGCSLSVPGGTNTGLALGVGLLGLGVAFARRRR